MSEVVMGITYDASNLKENSMGDDDFFRDMITLFHSQGLNQLSLIKSSISDGENKDWVEHSHSMKGTAAMILAEPLRTLSAQAQNMHNASAADRQKIYADIEQNFHEVCKKLQADGLLKIDAA